MLRHQTRSVGCAPESRNCGVRRRHCSRPVDRCSLVLTEIPSAAQLSAGQCQETPTAPGFPQHRPSADVKEELKDGAANSAVHACSALSASSDVNPM